MWDRYDPRSSDDRDRDDFGDQNRDGRGGLGGHFKTDNSWTGKTDNFRAAETREFYFDVSSVRKSEWTFVRQLFGPHLSTCA
jgi:hypothetical protein